MLDDGVAGGALLRGRKDRRWGEIEGKIPAYVAMLRLGKSGGKAAKRAVPLINGTADMRWRAQLQVVVRAGVDVSPQCQRRRMVICERSSFTVKMLE